MEKIMKSIHQRCAWLGAGRLKFVMMKSEILSSKCCLLEANDPSVVHPYVLFLDRKPGFLGYYFHYILCSFCEYLVRISGIIWVKYIMAFCMWWAYI